MKWFKHLSTLGESTSINNLIDSHGLIYYAHWVLFLELMAEKFEGNSTEFEINLSVISRKVRIKSNKKLTTFLQLLPNFFEITIEFQNKSVKVNYPNLLIIRDNHHKNLQVASKKVSENLPLDKDKDKDKEQIHSEKVNVNFSFNDAYKLYIVQIKGPKAEKRFKEQIKTQKDFDDLVKAIANYKIFLKRESWRKPKQAFDTFLGSESFGYFWREFIDYKTHAPISTPKHKEPEVPFEYNPEAREKAFDAANISFIKNLKIKEVPK